MTTEERCRRIGQAVGEILVHYCALKAPWDDHLPPVDPAAEFTEREKPTVPAGHPARMPAEPEVDVDDLVYRETVGFPDAPGIAVGGDLTRGSDT